LIKKYFLSIITGMSLKLSGAARTLERKHRPMRTQLGGKYSKEEQGLFTLKTHLVDAGVDIVHPIGNGIVSGYKGMSLCFDPVKEGKSFYEIELDYYNGIRTNPIHLVYNKFKEIRGYLGESASIELAYAMAHDIPAVLLYRPAFADSVPEAIRTIIDRAIDKVSIIRLDLLAAEEVKPTLAEISTTPISYGISVEDELMVMSFVKRLLDSFREV
jgi:hypothetical protein